MPAEQDSVVYVGIDIGGTFTDFVAILPSSGKILSLKVPSTPEDPAKAVKVGYKTLIEMIERAGLDGFSSIEITHGSTVATNAILEHRGAATALITTRGFRDVLQIGRQNRPKLYDLLALPNQPLIPEELRFEITERIEHNGQVSVPLNIDELDEIIVQFNLLKVESVAICFLFSFLHPEHEKEVADRLKSASFFVSLSSEILPEYREYERTSTTAINAYVSPVMDRFLKKLEMSLSSKSYPTRLRIMQSNGGNISMREASRSGVRCILSGPAGGIIGSRYVAGLALKDMTAIPPGSHSSEQIRIIAFDMGGTSTDVSLIEKEPVITTESEIAGYPIGIPMLDIHTIGAGGGSIASVDPGRALQVGPRSAGANPGPACYGRGDPADLQPTVTDANLILGRLPADHFLGGEIQLDVRKAARAIKSIGDELEMEEIPVALGIIEVVNTHMERALRVISIERGYDPEGFTLLSFGGAGGLHASSLARRLGIARVLVPPLAATLSALGMATANVVKDYSRTVMLSGSIAYFDLLAVIKSLEEAGITDLSREGIPPNAQILKAFLDMRYSGQSYELTIPISQDFNLKFHEAHASQYGYSRPDYPTEIVTIRLRAVGVRPQQRLAPIKRKTSVKKPVPFDRRSVYLSEYPETTPFYLGEQLQPGDRFTGPGIVVRSDTTVLIEPGDVVEVDSFHNLIIKIEK